ncbi:hypothetical protein [Moorella sp. E306M]|jgi:hypothetical protein|nr:hypothetical protein [Moorella sp. E306M]
MAKAFQPQELVLIEVEYEINSKSRYKRGFAPARQKVKLLLLPYLRGPG